MRKIKIYHGSNNIILKPEQKLGKATNDYGQGFYCTKELALASEWAVQKKADGIVNEYLLNPYGLKILKLDESYNILNWLAILLDNRFFTMNENTVLAKSYILENFLIDYKSYDVIIGYRADDSYFAFANDFVTNQISIEKLSKAMYLGKLGIQVFIQSQKAFEKLEFVQSHPAREEEYYPNYVNRDKKARTDYTVERNKNPYDGLFIREIIMGGIKNEDKRIPRIILK